VSFFLVFLAVALVAAVLWAVLGGRTRKTRGAALPTLLDGGFDEPQANLPPVLLPENAGPEDVARLRFSLGLRGYRMDQVDQVLDELADQLAARNTELAELRARLAAKEHHPGQPSGGGPAPAADTREDADPEAADGGAGSVRPEGAVQGKGGL
jgi:DivIVA domain-containing protein